MFSVASHVLVLCVLKRASHGGRPQASLLDLKVFAQQS